MTADWLAIFAAIGFTTVGEWLRRGNELSLAIGPHYSV